jgi:hypothetical protein
MSGEIAVMIVPLVIALGGYAYLVKERRKLVAARDRQHPAE